MTRRGWRALLVAAFAVAASAMLGVTALGVVWARTGIDTIGEVSFDTRLAIPPLAEPLIVGGQRIFDLRVQEGRTHLGMATPTPTWGVNGAHLAPTIRAERGDHVRMNVTNNLGETTTMHWHGMHLPARMDGGPHQPIRPGDTWSPDWVIDQPAATLWYHPHLHGTTTEHVYRGLAGMIILDDPQSGSLELPDEYGVDDVPVIVQDANLDGDGRLDTSARPMSNVGIIGETVMTNGTNGAYHEVRTERVRLRLLNASLARTYNFAMAGPDDQLREYQLIGTDGGLLSAPATVRTVRLSPGERAEIVVQIPPGENHTLRSLPVDLGTDPWNQRISGGDDRLDVLELRAAATLEPSVPVPERLVTAPDVDPAQASRTRRFELLGVSINGRRMDHRRIDEVVEAGSTEIWEVTNADGNGHNFHIHDVQFQVLDPDTAVQPTHAGWKDTVYVPPGQTLRLGVRFGQYTDPDAPYMFHCHLLRHEDQGMMGQFVVVAPGS